VRSPADEPEIDRHTPALRRGDTVALVPPDARFQVHVMGATGSGKSTLLVNLILGDVAAGRGTS
jgi:ABC-type lipoprotein export system ATPase subunit